MDEVKRGDIRSVYWESLKVQNSAPTEVLVMQNPGPLEIVRVVDFSPARQKIVLVRCFCNKFFTAFEHNIKAGNTKSCGCHAGRKYNAVPKDRE